MPYKITIQDSNLDNAVVLEETIASQSFSSVQTMMGLQIPGLEVKEPGNYTHENYLVEILDTSPKLPPKVLVPVLPPADDLPPADELPLDRLIDEIEDETTEEEAITDLLNPETSSSSSKKRRSAQ